MSASNRFEKPMAPPIKKLPGWEDLTVCASVTLWLEQVQAAVQEPDQDRQAWLNDNTAALLWRWASGYKEQAHVFLEVMHQMLPPSRRSFTTSSVLGLVFLAVNEARDFTIGLHLLHYDSYGYKHTMEVDGVSKTDFPYTVGITTRARADCYKGNASDAHYETAEIILARLCQELCWVTKLELHHLDQEGVLHWKKEGQTWPAEKLLNLINRLELTILPDERVSWLEDLAMCAAAMEVALAPAALKKIVGTHALPAAPPKRL